MQLEKNSLWNEEKSGEKPVLDDLCRDGYGQPNIAGFGTVDLPLRKRPLYRTQRVLQVPQHHSINSYDERTNTLHIAPIDSRELIPFGFNLAEKR